MQFPKVITDLLALVAPEKQADAQAIIAADGICDVPQPPDAPVTDADRSTWAAHNMPGTTAAEGCGCAVCKRVFAAEGVSA